TTPLHHHHIHSFPTRRSSDLTGKTTACQSQFPYFTHHSTLFYRCRNIFSYHWFRVVTCYWYVCHRDISGSFCFINQLRKYKSKRSEEHTSELQSRFDLVCRLL